jgi:pimeloyl-ACP methyl ester carboxylesterase
VERQPTDVADEVRRGASSMPAGDPVVEPEGYLVGADDGTGLHFLDWGAPPEGLPGAPGVLLLHGLSRTAWSWAPVARRLAGTLRVVAADGRGHGLSDAPTRGYDATTLALDVAAVADASGLLPGPVIVAGHGSGAIVAIEVATRLGDACAGLVLVDGGWDVVDPDEPATVEGWMRSIEEPPEVLASMAAFLADRAAFDPATWDADQERAARASVVELPAGRVVLVTRRHVLASMGETLLAHDPLAALPAVSASIVALAARDDGDGARSAALERARSAVLDAGRPAMRSASFPADGHDLVRYRPGAVAGAILDLVRDATVRDATVRDA